MILSLSLGDVVYIVDPAPDERSACLVLKVRRPRYASGFACDVVDLENGEILLDASIHCATWEKL